MTREEKLYDAITQVSDRLVEEGAVPCLRRSRPLWPRLAAAAACVAAVALAPRLFGQISNDSAAPGSSTESFNGAPADHGGGSVFMSYAGPILPLDVAGETGLTAERTVTLDFGRGDGSCAVTDACLLTNGTESDLTETVLYPFVGSLGELEKQTPALRVDGTAVETALYFGAYAGGFRDGGDGSGMRLNLAGPASWEQYKGLLEDGGYQQWALEGHHDLDIPAVVYRFSGGEGHPDHRASTVGIHVTTDAAGVRILTDGINGYSHAPGSGAYRYSYSVRHEEQPALIVLGGDLASISLQGYEDGGCDPGEEIDLTLPAYVREETTLGAALAEVAGDGLLYRAAADQLARYGLLSDDPAERYQDGQLEGLLQDVRGAVRVFYLAARVTVPAGGQAEVTALLSREASFDYACTHTENQEVSGYDLATAVGSDLTFTGQTAVLKGWEGMEIVRQNFGFDPENGVTEAPLTGERYYLEVREKRK